MVTLGTVLTPSQLLYMTEEGVWRTLRDSILAGEEKRRQFYMTILRAG